MVSAAFLRLAALGERRSVTAASLRAGLDLRGEAGFSLAFAVVLEAAVRGLRAAATGLVVRGLRRVVGFVDAAAVLRPPVAPARGLLAGVARFGAAFVSVRLAARAVDFAAVRARAPGAASVLRAGALRVAVVPWAVAALARVGADLEVRAAGLLAACRLGALVVLLVRDFGDLLDKLLAAAERAAGLLAVRVVRAVLLRLVPEAVRRPPPFTAMARALRPAGLLSSSLLMVWPFPACMDAI